MSADQNGQNEASTADQTDELSRVLSRRQQINEGQVAPENKMKVKKKSLVSVYYDNADMDKATIDEIKAKFDQYDLDKNGVLDEHELTLLFEKLRVPNNLLAVRSLIKAVDVDGDGCLNLDEFISIFRKVASESLDDNSALLALVRLTEIDVSKCGVKGAKDFFEVKIKESNDGGLARRMEEEKQRKLAEEEEKKRKKEEMKKKISAFELNDS